MMTKYLNILFLVLIYLFIASCEEDENNFVLVEKTVDFTQVPGTVIEHSPKYSQIYLGAPSICILPDGSYVASCDLNSTKVPYVEYPETWVYVSTDKGETWEQSATLVGQFWSQLFMHNGDLYLLGTSKSAGDIVIRKSTDNGFTWTTPESSTTGRLTSEGQYHCAPTPVVEYNGRLWRGMEGVGGGNGEWGSAFRAMMMSVPVNADLLDAANWTMSNQLGFNSTYLGGDFGGWLEGNAVVTPDNKLVDILRTHYLVNGDELASIVNISDDGQTATFDSSTGFVDFPGGCKKFSIRRDTDGVYWSLTNYVPLTHKGGDTERTRNTLALIKSDNLTDWTVQAIVLYHSDVSYHAFQYVDFQFEGSDIIFTSRTAYDDGIGGANSQHNSNFFTFHRISNYKTYTTPEIWANLMP